MIENVNQQFTATLQVSHRLASILFHYCSWILSIIIEKLVQLNQQGNPSKSSGKLEDYSWKIHSNDWLAPLLLPINVAIVALFALFTTPVHAAIRPNCRCIIFDDTFDKEYGVFTSPDWPVPYDDNIDCLLYTFIAQSDQIVEITFDEFDVQKSSDHISCDYSDYVKLFLHLDTDSVDETNVWNTPLLCGKFPDIEQTHFSSNSTLIFEFHTDWRTGNNTGFRGTFRFLKKAMFRTDGQIIDGTSCDYRFHHETNQRARKIHSIINQKNVADVIYSPMLNKATKRGTNSSSNQQWSFQLINPKSNSILTPSDKYWVGTRGYFFSPQYPSTYPKQLNCSYHFSTNDPNERIRLLFVEVSLQRNDQSCISNSDAIQIFDGGNSKADIISEICGHSAFLEILSSSNQLFVQFLSLPDTLLNKFAKGFKAEYSFVSVNSLIHGNVISFSPYIPYSPYTSSFNNYYPSNVWWLINQTSVGNGTSQTSSGTGISTVSISAHNCDRWFSSELHQNGSFTSPNYPSPYPANIRCNYHFIGHGKERVQIIFTEFDVHKVEDQHRNCEISDSLTAYIITNGQKEWIDDFCGNELPPQIMSNGHRLTLEFKSLNHDEDHRPYVRFDKKIKYPTPEQPFLTGNKNSVELDNYQDDEGNAKHSTKKIKKTGKNIFIQPNDEDNHSRAKDVNLNLKQSDNLGKTSSATIDLLGRSVNLYRNKGFKATFRFVTDFGIKTGDQDSKSVCGFVYNSTKEKSGYFTSPNYPGLYPKDTECHYFFYGEAMEKVHIKFTHFDVEGVTPCTLETASDYVEFSNAYSSDQRIYRHCGLKHPKLIESDADFFRVTFKSNGRFDGTGFKALYEFKLIPVSSNTNENQVTIKTIKTSSVTTSSTSATICPLKNSLMIGHCHLYGLLTLLIHGQIMTYFWMH